jgi:hypothetical protein
MLRRQWYENLKSNNLLFFVKWENTLNIYYNKLYTNLWSSELLSDMALWPRLFRPWEGPPFNLEPSNSWTEIVGNILQYNKIQFQPY